MLNTDYPPHVTDPSNYSWRERERTRPSVPEDETIVFDEPGRILPGHDRGTDCRSHYFVMTTSFGGAPTLYVKHGAGERKYRLGWDPRIVESLRILDSDHRFRMLLTLAQLSDAGRREGYRVGAAEYRDAFIEGRLRKRKLRGREEFKIEIVQPRPT